MKSAPFGFQVADCGAAFVRPGNREQSRRLGFAAVQHRTRTINARSDQVAGVDFLPPSLQRGEIASHVAHCGHAVCDQEREERRFAPFRIGGHSGEVNMRVAQARDEKFAATVDHADVVRRWRLVDADDSIA